MTNFEKLTAAKPELARFLRSLPILEAPWDTEFQKRYCNKCPLPDCDYCPHEEKRNDPDWWLGLKAE